jgi:hypothetical protein
LWPEQQLDNASLQLSQAVLLHEYDEVEPTIILHNTEGACEMILIISK